MSDAGTLAALLETDVSPATMSAALANELALDISPRKEVLERHGVSEAQWEVLRRAPAFRRMVAEAAKEWHSDLNAPRRTKLKAQILAEDGLVQLDKIVHDSMCPPAARIEAMKLLSRIAGVADTERDSGGAGFSVNIHLGSGERPVVIEGDSHAKEIRAD